MNSTLAIFDLDHTLLEGDSEVLWCEFLMDEGVLDRAVFGPRNRAVEAGYKAGTIASLAFCEFFVGTLAGHTPLHWHALRERFLYSVIEPRLLPAGIDAIHQHRGAGHTLLMSTATSRFLSERTAQVLGLQNLIATECAFDAEGRFTGRVAGEPNMREGKVSQLQTWLARQALPGLTEQRSIFYSDSMNDLPLLRAVDEAVVVNGDSRLLAEAARQGWRTLQWASG